MSDVFGICDIPDDVDQTRLESWDSVQHINLIVELEQRFNIDFEPEEIAEMISLDRIESAVFSKVN